MKYYIKHSMTFQKPANVYDIDLFCRTVRRAGGREIAISKLQGGPDESPVVTFEAISDIVKSNIQMYLDRLPVFKIFGCYILEKDW